MDETCNCPQHSAGGRLCGSADATWRYPTSNVRKLFRQQQSAEQSSRPAAAVLRMVALTLHRLVLMMVWCEVAGLLSMGLSHLGPVVLAQGSQSQSRSNGAISTSQQTRSALLGESGTPPTHQQET